METPDLNTPEGLATLIKAQLHLVKAGEATGDEFNWHNILKSFVEKQKLPDHMNPELRRWCVDRIKRIAKVAQPEYELPADSFLEACVLDIYNRIRNESR